MAYNETEVRGGEFIGHFDFNNALMKLNSYELSRNWFDFCFDNPEKINPNHTAIYFFAIEHCNRLGWKNKFGFPTQMAMEAIGIKKHQTYIKYFNDLVDWGFFNLVQKSTNQYSANIISLYNAIPKNGKALDKATITHAAKQTDSIGQSTGQSNSSIIKQDNYITNNLLNNEEKKQSEFYESDKTFLIDFNKARKHYIKLDTELATLTAMEKMAFREIQHTLTIDEIRTALQGMFEQKEIYQHSKIRPTHFLKNVELYRDAKRGNLQLFEGKTKKSDRL